MEVKPETANGPPVVKNETQNTPQKPNGGPQQSGSAGGPSGANRFNKGNMQNKNKNFQQQRGRGPPGMGPMGSRGPPKSEVSTFSQNIACFGHLFFKFSSLYS